MIVRRRRNVGSVVRRITGVVNARKVIRKMMARVKIKWKKHLPTSPSLEARTRHL
jgi:hypothetical protein